MKIITINFTVKILDNTLAMIKAKYTSGTHYYSVSTEDWVTGAYLVALISPTVQSTKHFIIIK